VSRPTADRDHSRIAIAAGGDAFEAPATLPLHVWRGSLSGRVRTAATKPPGPNTISAAAGSRTLQSTQTRTAASHVPPSAGGASASSVDHVDRNSGAARALRRSRPGGAVGLDGEHALHVRPVVLERASVPVAELEHPPLEPGEQSPPKLARHRIRTALLSPLEVPREARLLRPVERRLVRHGLRPAVLDQLHPVAVREQYVRKLIFHAPFGSINSIRRRRKQYAKRLTAPLVRRPARWRYHASRIFQKLSFRTILPSSPNVQMSHPRTSTRTPSMVVPLIVHSETPAVPTREVIVVPIVDVRDALEARRKSATHLVLPNEASSPSFGPPWGLEYTVLGEVQHDRVEVVLVEAAQHLSKHLCLPPGEHGLSPAPTRAPDAVR